MFEGGNYFALKIKYFVSKAFLMWIRGVTFKFGKELSLDT